MAVFCCMLVTVTYSTHPPGQQKNSAGPSLDSGFIISYLFCIPVILCILLDTIHEYICEIQQLEHNSRKNESGLHINYMDKNIGTPLLINIPGIPIKININVKSYNTIIKNFVSIFVASFGRILI